MNIKKYSLKTMCAALACTTVVSSMLAAYATDVIINETPMDDSAETETIETLADSSDSGWTTEENSFEDIKVTYQQSSNYAVTIPKTIALGTNKQAAYSVKVAGDIDANQRVYVAPVDGIADSENLDFYMKDLSGKKADVVATVTQNKTYWSSENVANAYEETNNSVSAPDLTEGTWEGTFQVEIRLETEKEQEHTHNYVDGKCECGAVDPNHTHNYEDGTCSICGKETDPYETAPASAYSNWNYTLDEENGIITLNNYQGSEANVIVYANYVINGITYKTQIASFGENGTSHGYYMFNAAASTSPKKNIKSIKFSHEIDTSNVTDMRGMFFYCNSLTSLDIAGFDTSNVTNMSGMFQDINYLTSLDVSGFDTSNVTDMSKMFYGCDKLANLDVSNFDTSNVTDMNNMFLQCSELIDLDVSGFDTSKVTNMSYMFSTCNKLTSIDVSGFDTSNVTNMSYMFANDHGLTSLDVSGWNTENVTNMSSMFSYCSGLTSLDLSNWYTSQVTDMRYMFQACRNLNSILVGQDKWSTSQANATGMFAACGTSEVTYK